MGDTQMQGRLPRSWKDSRNQAALGWEPLTMPSNPRDCLDQLGMSAIPLRGERNEVVGSKIS